MTETKPILREFVDWFEAAYLDAEVGAASEFAIKPTQGSMALAEMALDAALHSQEPVMFGSAVPVRSIIRALLLRRAGITLGQLYQRSFSEEQFEALIATVIAVRDSQLLVESQVERPGLDTGADW